METNRIRNPQRLRHFLQHLSTRCQKDYGFCINPSRSIQRNFNETITSQPSPLHLQPKYLTFHNLCQKNKTPVGTRQLLGLNLKFCLSGNRTFNNINNTMLRMARSIRTHFYLKQQNFNSDENYDKQIYVKLKNWHPPPAPLEVENQITTFEKLLKDRQQKLVTRNQKINLNNLTPIQKKVLKDLKANKNIIIKPTDKNLGPAAMDIETYIQQILQEHLLTSSYRQLTKEEAKHRTENLKLTFKNLFNAHKEALSKSETTYFQRSLQLHCRLPIFYGLPKVHKNPVSLRPVVSSCGSFMSILSTWLDFRLKSLLPFVKSYTKNSFNIITDLKHLQIPEHALLFTADAKSMYTNIDTNIGINSIRQFLAENSNEIPTDFPKDFFIEVLNIVMKNNIFSFDNTYWLQLTGTAMGTPVACSYATVSYGQHENKNILTTFSPNLLYYRRYIDDIFGIWLPPTSENDDTWEHFKRELNNWGTLEWVTETPSKHTTFLDLHLQLSGTTIITSTHQKDLNLYLYIPPRSAHPPSCLKGLIAGEMRRYWLQNNTENFQTILTKFIKRLTDRGHRIDDLIPLLHQAAITIDSNTTRNTTANNSYTLFIHWKFNPFDIQRSDLRRYYNSTLEQLLDYNKVTVATSRPKNLRDLISKTPLELPAHLDIRDMIQKYNETTEQH